MNSLEAYKESVDKDFGKGKEFFPSDRKKLLALPFYLAKRKELPEPKKGQWQYDLFTQMTGKEWTHYDAVKFDTEEKITEFNYEKFIPRAQLKNMDTSSEEFKLMIKEMNLKQKTQMEAHKDNQDQFKNVMSMLAHLTPREGKDFVHLLENKKRVHLDDDKQRSLDLIDQACSDEFRNKLAKISEDENFALKSYYTLDKHHLRFADKKKMPVDAGKVKDMLLNQHIYRDRIHKDLPTYRVVTENTEFERGVITFLNYAAKGAQRRLLDDVGVTNSSITYTNVNESHEKEDNMANLDAAEMFGSFLNTRFTQVDMTDYEFTFDGPEEHHGEEILWKKGIYNIFTSEQSNEAMEERDPVPPITEDEPEPPKPNAVNQYMRDIIDERAAFDEYMAELDENLMGDGDDDDEDEDDDDDDEEGEEGEDAEKPPATRLEKALARMNKDKYLAGSQDVLDNEDLRSQFNTQELDAFMKLLNIRPNVQWEDDSSHHYRIAAHSYEDESQELDPYYHLVGEVERRHAERLHTMEFRRGTEIKFLLDPKKKPVFNNP